MNIKAKMWSSGQTPVSSLKYVAIAPLLLTRDFWFFNSISIHTGDKVWTKYKFSQNWN